MTTILGIQYEDGFVIAAESQVTESERPFYHTDVKKITEVGDYVIAGAGISRFCDIIQYGWEPPEYDGSDPYRFMVSQFIPSMRSKHKETGYRLKDGESFKFIVGLNRKLYYIADDYSVLRTQHGIYAIGSGSELAMGAYEAGASIETALEIAIKHDINSGGDIQIVRRGGEDNA